MRLVSIGCNGRTLIETVEVASSLCQRLKGLLGRASLAPGCGMMIERCGAVHTIGMKFALDLIFLDADYRVKGVVDTVASGRLMVRCPGARRVIEVESGWLALDAFVLGTKVEVKEYVDS